MAKKTKALVKSTANVMVATLPSFSGISGAMADFLEKMDNARRSIGFSTWTGEDVCYYRGHGACEWPLLPSLFRDANAPAGKPSSAKRREHFWQLEYNLYFEFHARAREFHGTALTSWDVLFAMQHHGTPTRLLDWTETFGVALYFALAARSPDKQPCVWLLNPLRLNEQSWGMPTRWLRST
jgi:hypothetical protein